MKEPFTQRVDRAIGYDGVVEHLRWCRENLGTRGVDWDFCGGIGTLRITVYTEDKAALYLMYFPEESD